MMRLILMPDFIQLAKTTAASHGLQPELVCAVCEQESAWNPWAIRCEPAFKAHYIDGDPILGQLSDTEAWSRSFSWGLMQVLGEVARELGFSRPHFVSELCDPVVGLEYGCKHLANKMKQAGGDITKALLLWNGGGNKEYPTQVIARMVKYAQ